MVQDHLWSARILADDPAAIERVHQQYYEAGMYASTILCCRQLCMPGLACMQVAHAGADVATTASYQASFAGFERAGFGRSDAEELLRRSVRLADSARSNFWTRHEAAASGGAAVPHQECTQAWLVGGFLLDFDDSNGQDACIQKTQDRCQSGRGEERGH